MVEQIFFVTETGRVLSRAEWINGEKYLEVENYPVAPVIDGKEGYVSGIDIDNQKVIFSYVDKHDENTASEPTPEPPMSETDKKLLKIQATVDYLAMMTE